ncbi:TonB-linked SusC/RagA family outer membrane protein [Dysgonomonas sp. PFB1-18]|uniref:SusC/RagA family TonB-linked outer membrane protein n=1 Tax=unclassified Dysgonomonas TaxID=2630389 RepID=UPI002474B415|nr:MULTISPECIES: TonB-dependent receptor [unclassified Dysgonomonas]MDH6308574.1 TonB-linked SusC/RagA family outer membrane protein [Dysgonomonas sp. PF1-14]MDH6338075.1 TonB-linked SusC/RagA family outer membrane protein [Dysgonomonas sp. PF1-16]MDH6379572.1 TonB-linked SusC/RagA family outer membrane protein [Dysgonomonas sp. PFB1-18]MDH6396902.1 TonB-linked SusC/RagA family outer membrane protein [Dysgonomonas sp. PF1-23]
MKIKPKRTFITRGVESFFMKSFVLLACFFLASTVSIYAQTKTVSGLVTDVAKEPLIGVSVRIQGTTTGTVTDIDGQYSLSAKSGDVLEFSYVGMKTQLVTVGAQNTVNIVLQDDATMLTETVVIGYGTSKKADLTGSIGSVRSEDIMKQPAVNAVQSVQGKISGVNIVNNDAPGSTPTVIIRGLGTALGGRNPLYIVDGFPADDIRNISPSDIVSMDVLKDASSASIYGVRAANGVIIVTTKKGQSGSAKIGVESYVGIKTSLNTVKMANASQYVEYFNQNQDVLGKYHLKDAGSQAYDTDWYDELLKTGVFTNNTVSLSGGGQTVDYYLSYNYYDENGILDQQNYQRSTIRNNNVYKFFDDRLKFSQNLSISFSTDRPKPYGAFNEAYRQSPLVPVKFSNGRWGTSSVNTTTGIAGIDGSSTDAMGKLNSIGNPMFNVNNYSQKTKTLTLQGGLEGEFKITDFLKVNSRFGANKFYYKDRKFENLKEAWLAVNPLKTGADFDAEKAKNPASLNWANNSLRYEDIETYRWIWEGFATFNKRFDKHNVEAVVGMSREKSGIGNTSIMKGYDVPSKPQYWNIGMASDAYAKELDQYYYTPRALASYFARVQYNFDNKYYFTGTIRRDGSSTFKSNEDYWGTFPSVGFGWTISNESFMQDVNFLDYLKLRGTWGKLGNQDVPLNVNQIYSSTASDNYNYVFGPSQNLVYGAAYGSPVVPLTWEKTREWGIGFDFSMLNDRLTGGVDYYNKLNTNTILDVKPVGNVWYEKNFFAHGAEVENSGIEVVLAWNDKLANGLKYDISANYSYNKNRVKNVTPTYAGQTGGSLSDGQITKRLAEDQPLFAWWLLEADGVWQTQEEIDNATAKLGVPKPGHLKYKDQNGDGMIDDRDKVYMGSYLPTSSYGIHLGLEYKNVDFSIDGYGVAGNKIYNGLKHGRIDGGENITYDTYKNRWTGAGSTNEHPGANRDSYSSSYFLESGAFFRINNITLGYTFNDLVFSGSRLRFYFTAQNPFMFTGYSGFSPEISGYSNDRTVPIGQPSGTAGIELSAYPTTRNFIFGLNLQF